MTCLLVSCSSTKIVQNPVYIPQDRYQYPMTNELGVVGWFVPNAVHSEMMEAMVYMNSLLEPKDRDEK